MDITLVAEIAAGVLIIAGGAAALLRKNKTSTPATVFAPETPTAVPTPAPQTVHAPADEVETVEHRTSRLSGRFSKSQSSISQAFKKAFNNHDNDDAWTDLEDSLIMADLGARTASDLVDRLKSAAKAHKDADLLNIAHKELTKVVAGTFSRALNVQRHDNRPAVVLTVGVNGTGKTTTTGKLARFLSAEDKDVLLGAADTFRAAAADQLETWGERVGAVVVRGAEGSDPASVAFEAITAGTEQEVDVVLIDTAGRLHTKQGLMDELGKVHRVAEKAGGVDEVLLVIDATTGQNGLTQAKVFSEVVPVTGIVLTKLDGTAKGGIVIAVQQELGVPVKLVGLGEGADDLAPFDPEMFVAGLLN